MGEEAEQDVQISVSQVITELSGGDASGLEIGQSGDVTVHLHTYGRAGQEQRRFVPPTGRRSFFGREEELEKIRENLTDRKTVLLHGMAGIGKSALAAKLASAMEDDNIFEQGVLWVSEIGNVGVAFICDAIARHLGNKNIPKMPPQEKGDATRELLADQNDLLLVLDHLNLRKAAQTFVRRCLPGEMPLLVTSRNRYAPFNKKIETHPLKLDDANSLFCDNAGISADDEYISQICELLGRHPLALIIASGRVSVEGMPLQSLYDRLANVETKLQALRYEETDDKNLSILTPFLTLQIWFGFH